LTNFFDYIRAIVLAMDASSKLFETIDRIPSVDIASDTGDKPENFVGHIQIKNINFIYPTRPDVKTLNNISLDVEPGFTVAIVGSSGSGKSTIVSLLPVLRFYDPLSGDIFLDGRNIKSLNLIWLRRQIGFVSQELALFKTTIAENVSYGLIGSIYENLPDNEKRERIENAYPKILLFDEATSALDTQSESIVQNALDKTAKGRTTIVIAYRLSIIRNATKIIVMNKGVIAESGTHKELMDKK
ncbi:664_t:CDS:2, partial [Gigaspora rosea]